MNCMLLPTHTHTETGQDPGLRGGRGDGPGPGFEGREGGGKQNRYTVEPLNNGHVGTDHFAHYRDVVLFQRQKCITTI